MVPTAIDTLWYVSARARDNGRDTRRLADSLEYGLVIRRAARGSDSLTRGGDSLTRDGDFLTRDADVTPIDSVRLTASAFASALRSRAESRDDSLTVLYVHGFGTSLHEAWEHAAQSSVRSRSSAPWVVFCWPSNGSGVAWPRAGEFLVRAYRQDSAAAVASRAAFSQAVRALLPAVGGANLVVVAHSLGSQLVGEAIAGDSVLRAALATDPLRALAFFAPDVESRRFNELVLPAVLPLTRRIVVYASSVDRLLALSRRVNHSERAGLIRSATQSHAGVEIVNVTNGFAAEDRLRRVFGSHHALPRASAALFDLLQIVARRFPAECRATLGTARREAEGVWRMTAIRPPEPEAVSGCAR